MSSQDGGNHHDNRLVKDVEKRKNTLVTQPDAGNDNEMVSNEKPQNSAESKEADPVSLPASEIDSPPKHAQNIVKSKIASKSKTVKGKEEKNLKKGVGTVEYEVMQTEKLQDNIDRQTENQRFHEVKSR